MVGDGWLPIRARLPVVEGVNSPVKHWAPCPGRAFYFTMATTKDLSFVASAADDLSVSLSENSGVSTIKPPVRHKRLVAKNDSDSKSIGQRIKDAVTPEPSPPKGALNKIQNIVGGVVQLTKTASMLGEGETIKSTLINVNNLVDDVAETIGPVLTDARMVSRDIRDSIDKIPHAANTLNDTINNATDKINPIADRFQATVDQVANMLSAVPKTLDDFKNSVASNSLLSGVYDLVKRIFKFIRKLSQLLIAGTAAYYGPSVTKIAATAEIALLLSELMGVCQPTKHPLMQDTSTSFLVFSQFKQIVICFFKRMNWSLGTFNIFVTQRTNGLSGFDKVKAGLIALIDYLIEGEDVLKVERNRLALKFANIHAVYTQIRDGYKQLSTAALKHDAIVEHYLHGESVDGVSLEGVTYIDFAKYYIKIYDKFVLMSCFFTAGATAGREYSNTRDLLVKYVKDVNFDYSKPETVGLFLKGGPGVGKTLLMKEIIPNLVNAELESKYGRPFIDDRGISVAIPLVFEIPNDPSTEKFWNGYKGQPFVCIDEYGLSRDGNDIGLPYRYVNSIKTGVNMAAVEDKDTVFVSDFLIATSNVSPSVSGKMVLNDLEGLQRRFKLSYEVSLSRNGDVQRFVMDGKLNLIEVQRHADPLSILNKVIVFTELDITSGVKGRTVTLREVARKMADAHRANARCHNTSKQYDYAAFVKESQSVVFGSTYQGDGNDTDDTFASCQEDEVESEPMSSQDFEAWLDAQDKEGPWDFVPINELNMQWLRIPLVNYIKYPIVEAYLREKDKNPLWRGRTLVKSTKPQQRWTGLQKFFIAAGVMVGVVGIGAAIYSLFQLLSQTIKNHIANFQSYAPKETVVPKEKVQIPKKIVIHQDDYTSDVVEKIRKNIRRVKRSTYDIQGTSELGSSSSWCLCISQSELLVPAHMVERHLQVGEQGGLSIFTIGMVNFDGTHMRDMPITVSAKNTVLLQHQISNKLKPADVMYVRLAEILPYVRDISKFFGEPKDDYSNDCILIGKNKSEDQNGALTSTWFGHEYAETGDGEYTRVAMMAKGFKTELGDCGRPYLVKARAKEKFQIIGLHSAWVENENLTCVAPLSNTWIQQSRLKLNGPPPLDVQYQDIVETGTKPSGWPDIDAVGTISINRTPITYYTPNKTALEPIFVQGKRVITDEMCDFIPASLRANVRGDPLTIGLSKYVPDEYMTVPRDVHEMVINYFESQFDGDRRKTVLNEDEIINGFGTMKPIAKDTSCGLWRQYGFKEGKKEFLSALPQVEGDILRYEWSIKARTHKAGEPFNDTFVDYLSKLESELREGVVKPQFWLSTLKDELRPKKKVLSNKTRLFEQSPLHLTVLFRKYFGAMLENIKSKPGFRFMHSIGVDKEAVWAKYYNDLLTNSNMGHAFDFSNFDGSVPNRAFSVFLEVANRYYEGEGDCQARTVREALIYLYCNGLHIANGFMFATDHGNKSGSPFTDIFNSVTNVYYLVSTHIILQSVHGLNASIKNFLKDVKMLTYGDDVIATVAGQSLKFYTATNIKAVLSVFGFTITSAYKDEDLQDFLPFSRLMFLKSQFVKRGDIVYCPMDKLSIIKELRYRPKSAKGDVNDLYQRSQNVLRFMAHHGVESVKEMQDHLAQFIPREHLYFDKRMFDNDILQKQNAATIYYVK